MNDKSYCKVSIGLATPADRPSIYRMRHEVYATELGQHAMQPNEMLSDAIDDGNIYIVAKVRGQLAGFISVTPPTLAGTPSKSMCDEMNYQLSSMNAHTNPEF